LIGGVFDFFVTSFLIGGVFDLFCGCW